MVADTDGSTVDLDTLRAAGRDPKTGRLLPGHLVNLKHGGRLPAQHQALAPYVEERVGLLVAQLGGADSLTAAEHWWVRSAAHWQILDEMATAELTGPRGLSRAVGKHSPTAADIRDLVERALRINARAEALTKGLGFERRAKRVKGTDKMLEGLVCRKPR